jgi:MFS superfamily sulfate permease-like transporter
LFDVGVAVLVGTVIALLYLLEKTTDGTSEVSFYNKTDLVKRIVKNKIKEEDVKEGNGEIKYDTVVYSVGGFLSYIDAEHHLDNILEISNLKDIKKLGIRMRNLDYADFEALEDLAATVEKIKAKNISVFVSSPHDTVLNSMLPIKTFAELSKNNLVYKTTAEALK